jgi:chromosome segregation ATPase
MAPKISLIRSDSGLPSDRAGLVAALQAAEAAKAALTKHRAAIDRVRSQAYGMDGKIKAAETKIEEERAAHARVLADAATENMPAPASGIKAARQALSELQDERETVKIALHDLRAHLPDAEYASLQADADVDAEINKLLQPLASELIARDRRLTAELAHVRGTLAALLSSGDILQADRDWRVKRTSLTDLVREDFGSSYGEKEGGVSANVWREARAALRRDPNAPLPQVGTI